LCSLACRRTRIIYVPNAVAGTAVPRTPLGTFITADTAPIELILAAAECTVAAGIGHGNLSLKTAGAGVPVGTIVEDTAANCVTLNGPIFLEFSSKCTRSVPDKQWRLRTSVHTIHEEA
jgi:hypothetical protein